MNVVLENIQKQILQNVRFVQQELLVLQFHLVENVIIELILKKDGVNVNYVVME